MVVRRILNNPNLIKFVVLCGLLLPELVLMVLVHKNIGGSIVLSMHWWVETVSLCSMAMLALVFHVNKIFPVYIVYTFAKILLQIVDRIIKLETTQGFLYQLLLSAGSSLIDFGIMILLFVVILQILKLYANRYVCAVFTVLGLVIFKMLSVFFKFLITFVPFGNTDIFKLTYVYITKNPNQIITPVGIWVGLILINYIFNVLHKKSLQN